MDEKNINISKSEEEFKYKQVGRRIPGNYGESFSYNC